MYIVRVCEDDIGLGNLHPGLRKLNKMKEEHINLSPRHRLRVKLAAQVNKFNVSKFQMHLSVFSHLAIRRSTLHCFTKFCKEKIPQIFFPRFRWRKGLGRGKDFHKFLISLTSFFIIYILMEDRKQIKTVLYMCTAVASKRTHLVLKKWHIIDILISVIRG